VASQFRARIAAMPGVASVSWGSSAPLAGAGSRRAFGIHGYQPAPGEDTETHMNEVGPAFFETMDIPIVSGRAFDGTEAGRSPDVAIVNESFARRYWPGRDAIGQQLGMGNHTLTVIGVVRDVRFLSVTDPPRPYVFLSALQRTARTLFLVRTTGDPLALVPALSASLGEIAPGWTLGSPRTLQDQIGRLVFQQRAASVLIGTFAVLAILLAAVGLYGVIAFSVAQRTREIGVRIALGARPAAVSRLFLRRAVPIVTVGAAAGLAAALGVASLLRSMLVGITPRDPLSFLGSAALLACIAFLASWLPARGAARIDPGRALRTD
jgi:putative ABC transport system permease protein